jgi:hypothetical protein
MLGHRPAAASLSPELWERHILAKDKAMRQLTMLAAFGIAACSQPVVPADSAEYTCLSPSYDGSYDGRIIWTALASDEIWSFRFMNIERVPLNVSCPVGPFPMPDVEK